MTPYQKAQELIDEYMEMYKDATFEKAKQYAYLVVGNMIDEYYWTTNFSKCRFWNDVHCCLSWMTDKTKAY